MLPVLVLDLALWPEPSDDFVNENRHDDAERGIVAVMGAPRTKYRLIPHGRPLPPPKPGERHVRLPRRGVIIADDDLRQSVSRRFHMPMILLALLFLPLLAIEFFVQPEKYTWLWWLMMIGLSTVWLAFVIEFLVKISIAESRLEYCRRNWLDIVIILVPILRTLRIAQVVKTTRVFTLRGVAMKALRYAVVIVLGMEYAERLLQRLGVKARDGRPDPREMTRHQLMEEVRQLRKLTDAWLAWHEAHLEHQREHGHDGFAMEPPDIDNSEANSLHAAASDTDGSAKGAEQRVENDQAAAGSAKPHTSGG